MKKNIQRALIEMAFIIFLFYSNLLMGQFTSSGMGQEKGLAWAVLNIFTRSNFMIAVVAAFVGYIVFEYLREKL
jgi:hypothetical protein